MVGMSTKVKSLSLAGLTMLLMAMLMHPIIRLSSGTGKHPMEYLGFIMVALAGIGVLFLVLLFLSWLDIPLRGRETYAVTPLQFILYLISAVIVAFFFVMGPYSRIKLGVKAANSSGVFLNRSLGQNVQTYGKESAGGHSIPYVGYLPYFIGLIVLAVLAYFLWVYYREVLRKRERREMRRRAKLFDKRLEEAGLDMFENPRDAVVGIYKNAVLWLEALNLPYKESWTHWEHAGHVRYMHETFSRLTVLFEKAKYAPEKVTWDDAAGALEAYRRMRGGLHEGKV
ncbi:DUF4129 domain-containing protein [Thermococcus sp.]|uniref:DUF4129 domain-containing protein n=1 Tax=Thermococcus sp. TaxID=35749 RepID=UPI00261F1416|nr:DUF4129 domain-containing protein [Thermococcus sp.]